MGYYYDMLTEVYGLNVSFNDDGTMEVPSGVLAEADRESQSAIADTLMDHVHHAHIVALLNEHPIWKHEFAAFEMSAEGSPVAAQELVSRIAREWRSTSSDSNVTSLALQKAVAKRFGLTDNIAASSATSEKAASQLFADHEEAFLGIVDAVYKDTQDTLEAYGIKKLVVYRGMRVGRNDAGPGMKELHAALSGVMDAGPKTDIGVTGKLTMSSNPISSYSASPGVAFAFAGLTTSNSNTAVLGRVVNAKDVFALPVGTLSHTAENEVVVLGRRSADVDVLMPSQPFTADEFWEAIGGQ